jgi:hypothetical protein
VATLLVSNGIWKYLQSENSLENLFSIKRLGNIFGILPLMTVTKKSTTRSKEQMQFSKSKYSYWIQMIHSFQVKSPVQFTSSDFYALQTLLSFAFILIISSRTIKRMRKQIGLSCSSSSQWELKLSKTMHFSFIYSNTLETEQDWSHLKWLQTFSKCYAGSPSPSLSF